MDQGSMTKLLRKKAFGFMKSIEAMGAKDREREPRGSYGRDYNSLRRLVIEQRPDLEVLLPPEVKIDSENYDPDITIESFAEIHTYCSQIFELLDPEDNFAN